MTIERFTLDDQMAPVSHYCHSVRAGNLIWVSGIVGMRADGTIPDDTVSQFDIAMDAMDACLRAAGGRPENVVKVQIFLTRTAKQALRDPAIGNSADNNLRSAVFDRDCIQRLGNIAMAANASRSEPGIRQRLDRRLDDARPGDLELLFPALVALGVFFWRLEGEWRPFDHIDDQQLAVADESSHFFCVAERTVSRAFAVYANDDLHCHGFLLLPMQSIVFWDDLWKA